MGSILGFGLRYIQWIILILLIDIIYRHREAGGG